MISVRGGGALKLKHFLIIPKCMCSLLSGHIIMRRLVTGEDKLSIFQLLSNQLR